MQVRIRECNEYNHPKTRATVQKVARLIFINNAYRETQLSGNVTLFPKYLSTDDYINRGWNYYTAENEAVFLPSFLFWILMLFVEGVGSGLVVPEARFSY